MAAVAHGLLAMDEAYAACFFFFLPGGYPPKYDWNHRKTTGKLQEHSRKTIGTP